MRTWEGKREGRGRGVGGEKRGQEKGDEEDEGEWERELMPCGIWNSRNGSTYRWNDFSNGEGAFFQFGGCDIKSKTKGLLRSSGFFHNAFSHVDYGKTAGDPHASVAWLFKLLILFQVEQGLLDFSVLQYVALPCLVHSGKLHHEGISSSALECLQVGDVCMCVWLEVRVCQGACGMSRTSTSGCWCSFHPRFQGSETNCHACAEICSYRSTGGFKRHRKCLLTTVTYRHIFTSVLRQSNFWSFKLDNSLKQCFVELGLVALRKQSRFLWVPVQPGTLHL